WSARRDVSGRGNLPRTETQARDDAARLPMRSRTTCPRTASIAQIPFGGTKADDPAGIHAGLVSAPCCLAKINDVGVARAGSAARVSIGPSQRVVPKLDLGRACSEARVGIVERRDRELRISSL